MKKDDLLLCAFRYALPRSTYIVSEMTRHIKTHWSEINPIYQKMIVKEIEDAIKQDRCGMKMDEDEWKCLINEIDII